ncbi:MAG: hypothetical protein M9918_08940 [Anaerolineae bacterium]|nr:hypothetical protein [Anaerolineae bacterium]
MRHRSFILLLFLLLTLACGQGTVPPNPTPTPPTIGPRPAAPFTIAVEYAIPGLAQAYAASGVTSVKLRPEFGKWGNLENVQGSVYWGTLDSLVREYQGAGFSDIQIVLMADSPWASEAPTDPEHPLEPRNPMPKFEHLQHYGQFVRQVAERYDMDGVQDMEGLRFPINRFAVEAEFSGFWGGSAEEYVQLLRVVYPAIHHANQDAEVALVGLLMADAFSGAQTVEEADQRLGEQFAGRKSKADIEQILSACKVYDVVDFHSLGDYTEIPLSAEWIRTQLNANGCGDHPILVGDAFSMSALLGYVFSNFHPATPENREQVVHWLQAMADPNSADHLQAKAWLRAEMARNLVRKIVVSAGAGLRGINIGNFEDWRTRIGGLDAFGVVGTGTSMFMGLMDTSKTRQYAGSALPFTSHEFSRINRPSSPRPAFYALQLVNAKIGTHTTAERIDLGEHVWAYRFEAATGSVWVLWADDGVLYFPGETPPTIDVLLPIDGETATVTLTPTEIGRITPETITVTTLADENGYVLPLTVGSTPIFVETAP